MKGLLLSKQFYVTYGKDMIESCFPQLAHRIAVGLAGEGSECLGFDDELSTDHDFEPAFCLWLTEQDERQYGMELARAYRQLPKEFGGFSRERLAPVGGSRHGVMSIAAFYTRFLGLSHAPNSYEQWLYIPSPSLGCACNGEVFRDDLGEFSAIRQVLLQGYPEDIRRKKLAGHAVMMAQAGLYNYARCVKRGETGAAQLAVFEFVRHAMSTVYLLNQTYEPFYKWAYRGLRELPLLSFLEPSLVALTELGNTEAEATAKRESMEEIAALCIAEYRRQGLTNSENDDLERQAYAIVNGIADPQLRNRHIMDGV